MTIFIRGKYTHNSSHAASEKSAGETSLYRDQQSLARTTRNFPRLLPLHEACEGGAGPRPVAPSPCPETRPERHRMPISHLRKSRVCTFSRRGSRPSSREMDRFPPARCSSAYIFTGLRHTALLTHQTFGISWEGGGSSAKIIDLKPASRIKDSCKRPGRPLATVLETRNSLCDRT